MRQAWDVVARVVAGATLFVPIMQNLYSSQVSPIDIIIRVALSSDQLQSMVSALEASVPLIGVNDVGVFRGMFASAVDRFAIGWDAASEAGFVSISEDVDTELERPLQIVWLLLFVGVLLIVGTGVPNLAILGFFLLCAHISVPFIISFAIENVALLAALTVAFGIFAMHRANTFLVLGSVTGYLILILAASINPDQLRNIRYTMMFQERKFSISFVFLPLSIAFASFFYQLPRSRLVASHPDYPPPGQVDPDKVRWTVPWNDYSPREFTHRKVHQKFAEEKDSKKCAVDPIAVPSVLVLRSRLSYHQPLRFDRKTHRPLNPNGRTGISGRGTLPRWGPNQASDLAITRQNKLTEDIELILIQRRDTGQWAIPGGKLDSDESAIDAAAREFAQEAAGGQMDSVPILKELLKDSSIVYQGIVTDPRNTDNAWMETSVFHVHVPPHDAQKAMLLAKLTLKADDDALDVSWVSLNELSLDHREIFPPHKKFLERIKNRAMPA